MKKQLAILLLLCYTLVWLRPLVPVVSNWLAHTFWLSEHITTVHYENGHYHVHYELKEISEDTKGDLPLSSSSKQIDETIQTHLFNSPHRLIIADPSSELYSFLPSEKLQAVFIPVNSPPPWC